MSGPDSSPWGRSQLLTFGVQVISEWWESIHQAFLFLLFLLLESYDLGVPGSDAHSLLLQASPTLISLCGPLPPPQSYEGSGCHPSWGDTALAQGPAICLDNRQSWRGF